MVIKIDFSKTFKVLFGAILFLGVLPFEKNALFLYKNEMLGNVVAYVLNGITLLLALVYCFKNSKKNDTKKIAFIECTIFIFLFLLIVVFSAILNDNLSFRRIASIICFWGYFCFSIYYYDNYKDLIKAIGLTSTVLVILSIVLYYVGDVHVLYSENAYLTVFKGVALNRNGFVEFGLFSILASTYAITNGEKKLINLCIVLLSAYSIIITNSATSIICLLLFTFLMLFKRILKNINILKWMVIIYILFFLIMLVLPSLETYLFSYISAAFGKASILTGRTKIWEISFGLIAQKPILGYSMDTSILLANGILEDDPHNGILYIMLTQGITGIVFVLYLFKKILGNINKIVEDIPQIYPVVVFIVCWFCRGLVESSLSYTHFGFWILLIIIRLVSIDIKTRGNIYE